MTDKHDKLVALLRECGAEEAVTGLFYVTVKDIAAFAAAHVASLCADVKPWVWLVTGSRVFDDQVEFTQSKAEARIAERKDGSECVPLVPASTVAAITAQRDAALARLVNLEKILEECSDNINPERGFAEELEAEIRSVLNKGEQNR